MMNCFDDSKSKQDQRDAPEDRIPACSNPEGHLWRFYAYAKDGTAFYRCVRCGQQFEE